MKTTAIIAVSVIRNSSFFFFFDLTADRLAERERKLYKLYTTVLLKFSSPSSSYYPSLFDVYVYYIGYTDETERSTIMAVAILALINCSLNRWRLCFFSFPNISFLGGRKGEGEKKKGKQEGQQKINQLNQ